MCFDQKRENKLTSMYEILIYQTTFREKEVWK